MEIYKEWAASSHATAFVSKTYRRATDDYRFGECLSCHAPEPMMGIEQPAVRPTNREAGIVCVTCHLDHGSMVGPNRPTGIVKPHPIRVDPAAFNNGTLCGRCHQSTLAQWQAATTPEKQDCRTCHMPEVRRTMTQATGLISRPLVAAETPGIEHRHSFCLTAEDSSNKSCELEVIADKDHAKVTLHNLLPHSLPTGDFGVRIIRLLVNAVDNAGKESSVAEWDVYGKLGGPVPAGESRSWTVLLPSDTQRLVLQLVHQGRDAADQVVLLRKEVAVP